MSDRDQSEHHRLGPSDSPEAQDPAKRPWAPPVVSRVELINSTKKCYAPVEGPVFYGPS
jgi:hypothetical protein